MAVKDIEEATLHCSIRHYHIYYIIALYIYGEFKILQCVSQLDMLEDGRYML